MAVWLACAALVGSCGVAWLDWFSPGFALVAVLGLHPLAFWVPLPSAVRKLVNRAWWLRGRSRLACSSRVPHVRGGCSARLTLPDLGLLAPAFLTLAWGNGLRLARVTSLAIAGDWASGESRLVWFDWWGFRPSDLARVLLVTGPAICEAGGTLPSHLFSRWLCQPNTYLDLKSDVVTR
jgi:hypothetical protein